MTYAKEDSTRRVQPLELTKSPVLREQLLDAMRHGVPPNTAFRALGYVSPLFWRWTVAARTGIWPGGGPVPGATLEVIRDFVDAAMVAIGEFEAERVEHIHEATNAVNKKTGLKDWKADAWLLEHNHITRKNWAPWRDPVDMNVTGRRAVGPEFREAKELSDDELLEGLDDPQWQALLGPDVTSASEE